MSLITFLSDFGKQDHYVATVKASILKLNPGITVLDIAHEIPMHNIAHAGFVLRSIYDEFPKGTVHLVCVDAQYSRKARIIAAKINEHIFVAPDNGVLTLLEQEIGAAAEVIIEQGLSTFPEKNVMARVACSLASGSSIYDVGTQLSYPLSEKSVLKPSITPNKLTGQVIHIDAYGNLIVNLNVKEFLKFKEDRNYRVILGREVLERIYKNYFAVEKGEAVAIFNSLGLLEIAIVNGNAHQLLGLEYADQVSIEYF